MKTYKILVVDDERDIVDVVSGYLKDEGYEIIPAYDGYEALELVHRETPHLVVLDVMMPGMDGFEVCRQLRSAGPIPVLMLTAKTEDVDKIIGLELGADDYMVKPFNPRELTARVKAILRRSYDTYYQVEPPADVIRFRDIEIDLLRRKVLVRGQNPEFTAKEFELLAFLASHPGRVFSRDQLLDDVWGRDYFVGARTVDVHIRRLREQVEADPANPEYILTVWGVGYRFAED